MTMWPSDIEKFQCGCASTTGSPFSLVLPQLVHYMQAHARQLRDVDVGGKHTRLQVYVTGAKTDCLRATKEIK